MATKKSSKKKSTRMNDIKKTVSTTASSVIDEIEKAGDVVAREVREGFDAVSKKASVAAKSAADASSNVKGIVADADPKQLFHSLVEEVEEITEQIVDVVKSRFSQLGETARSAGAKKPAKKKASKKKATKKKATK